MVIGIAWLASVAWAFQELLQSPQSNSRTLISTIAMIILSVIFGSSF